jgi:RNA polymerase sigma-70 factor (ECF subfamily)
MGDAEGVERRTEDLALARRAAAGEREAERALFRAHKDRVHLVLYRVMGTNRHMEDLVQDAFLEIFRSIGSFRGDASLATFVDRITARVAYRHLTKHRDNVVRLEAVREPAVDGTGDGQSPERRAAARDAVRRLYAILERLDPKYRIAYVLHEIDGRSVRQVAEVTEVSTIAAKNRIVRARRRVEESARRDPVLATFLAAGRREGDDQ